MFFQLLFSFFQISLIPGLIIFLLLNKRLSFSSLLLLPVITFALSLIINYIIVFFLAYFHTYTRPVMTGILILELCLLTGIFVFLKPEISLDGKTAFIKDLRELYFQWKSVFNLINLIFFLFSVILLLYLLIIMILNFGKIFTSWDAIFSWNKWALDFSKNMLAANTYHYPQLIPANWSVAYVLCGFPFQFIPKGIMPLFLIFPVYSFIILGIIKKSPFYIYAILFVFVGMNRLHWADGFVDVPVAFFSILVFINLLLIKTEDSESDKQKNIFISILIACGAAATKQAGIFTLAVSPLLLYFVVKNKFEWSFGKLAKFVFLYVVMIALVVLPYYIYAVKAIEQGNAASEIGWVTNGIYKGASYPERFKNACTLFSGIFSSRKIFILSALFFLFSFSERSFRTVNVIFVLPYFVIWALFFSYDLRNSAILIPYFCLGIGFGLEVILNKVQKSLA